MRLIGLSEHREPASVWRGLLFFTRLVGEDLFDSFPTLNFHPSLLPAFKGFKPLEQAVRANAKVIGATLHIVDESIDWGPILVQVSNSVNSYDMAYLGKLSFLQKTLLAYFLVDLLTAGDIDLTTRGAEIKRAGLTIKNRMIMETFNRIQEENDLYVI